MAAPHPTERVQRVLIFASDEADGLGHAFVTCQHLLYALSMESQGLAQAVLLSLGAEPETIRALLAERGAPHDRTEGIGLDLADEIRVVLSVAAADAAEQGHRWLDTEHLLAAIAKQRTSADELLAELRINPAALLNELSTLKDKAPPRIVREEAVHAYRFTLESAWLLGMASEAARQTASSRVSALHLLAALLRAEDALGNLITEGYGLSVDVIMRRAHGPHPPRGTERLPLSGDIQRALGYAIGEAWNRGHQAVSPLHIALGLFRAEQHPALDLLAEYGASRADLLEHMERLLPPAT